MSSKLTSSEDVPQSAAKAIIEGYNQTYIIMKNEPQNSDAKSSSYNEGHEVLFRCGNWCYHGYVQFGHLQLTTSDLPLVIPTLQKQQSQLLYYCLAASIPKESKFSEPVEFLNKASIFFASEILSPKVENDIQQMSNTYSWIDDDASSTYFELELQSAPTCMNGISIIASKTYTSGLIIISIYCGQSIYFMLQSGEGDQQLLDVRFPDVSDHGQGINLRSYNDSEEIWSKLFLWHCIDSSDSHKLSRIELPKPKTLSIASQDYQQTYCIMKSAWDESVNNFSVYHDAIFRFGSWCYAGRVQLVPVLSLPDVPFIIPALRVQQSRMDYLCDARAIPITSPFAAVLDYVNTISPIIEQQVQESESTLNALISRLSNIGLGDSVRSWLDGDPNQSFFEFKVSPDAEYLRAFESIDLVVSKSYQASGIITIMIIFQDSFYVVLQDGSHENPLLDSKFPDVSGKGRGYQLGQYDQGIRAWPILRKVSIWQTYGSLEQEYRDKASKQAQTKGNENLMNLENARDDDDESRPANDIENNATTEVSVISKSLQTSVSLRADSKDILDDYEKRSPILSPKESSNEESTRVPATRGFALESLSSSSRPHHIPKSDTLSKRLDEMRKTLGNEGMTAPWDSRGKPLGQLSAKK